MLRLCRGLSPRMKRARTDLVLRHQVFEKRGEAAGGDGAETHAQQAVRVGGVEARSLCERYEALVCRGQAGYADRISVIIALDESGSVRDGCRSILGYASFVVFVVVRTAIVA